MPIFSMPWPNQWVHMIEGFTVTLTMIGTPSFLASPLQYFQKPMPCLLFEIVVFQSLFLIKHKKYRKNRLKNNLSLDSYFFFRRYSTVCPWTSWATNNGEQDCMRQILFFFFFFEASGCRCHFVIPRAHCTNMNCLAGHVLDCVGLCKAEKYERIEHTHKKTKSDSIY